MERQNLSARILGKCNPDIKMLLKWAAVLKCDVLELIELFYAGEYQQYKKTLDNKNTTENTIYNAYGYTVNAIEAIYKWTYDNSNREQKCYTMVSVLDSKNVEILRYNGFNNPTFAEILEKNIDCFLWWIKTDKPENKQVKIIYEATTYNNDLNVILAEIKAL